MVAAPISSRLDEPWQLLAWTKHCGHTHSTGSTFGRDISTTKLNIWCCCATGSAVELPCECGSVPSSPRDCRTDQSPAMVDGHFPVSGCVKGLVSACGTKESTVAVLGFMDVYGMISFVHLVRHQVPQHGRKQELVRVQIKASGWSTLLNTEHILTLYSSCIILKSRAGWSMQ